MWGYNQSQSFPDTRNISSSSILVVYCLLSNMHICTCKESFLPPFSQLAVIISNISPMFVPGEPETTKQQRQNFSTDSTLSTDAAAKASLIGHVVCSVTSSKCWDLMCVFCRHIKETPLFRNICLGNKHTAQHSQRANEISQLKDVTLRPL